MAADYKTGPLAGITVVDLTRVLAGPFCTLLLSDLGARVIKVEHPAAGDDARKNPPIINGKSGYFISVSRGKESIALNLKSEADREVFARLLGRADVLVENFRPGVMDRFGLAWEALHERYPRLIVASVSGFGQTGPYSKRPAYDLVVQAMGGIMSITGGAEGVPTRVGTSIGDLAAGVFAVLGIATALYERSNSGKGSRIDVSMLDCQVALLENAFVRYQASGEVPTPIGARHPSVTPFDAFRAKDGHFVVCAGNDALFVKLVAALGMPWLASDPRFSTNPARTEHEVALKADLEDIFMRDTVSHWLAVLDAAGVPAGPINGVRAILEDQQVRSRGMILEVDDPRAGRMMLADTPIRMSTRPGATQAISAPELDEHRERILRELGFPTQDHPC